MKWYVMNVFSNKEKSIKEKIEKEIEIRNLTKYVNRILIPKEKQFQIKNGKKVKQEKNYFPGYLMIECDMNGELLRRIKNITGVVSFLGENTPLPMRDSEVAEMLRKYDELQDDSNDKEFVIVGQKIKIIDGPFSSMVATVTDVTNDKRKLKVDVNIFGRVNPLDLTFDQITFE